MTILRLDAAELVDDFHEAFSNAFGFFDGYGRNMDAWIDVMSSMTDSPPGLSDFRLQKGETLTLYVQNAQILKDRRPEIYIDLLECTALVNARYARVGEPAPIALALEVQ